MKINIIVAVAENNAIGKNNQLLWHISDDLKRFKKLTLGKTVLMGRLTYYSLPNGALPNRRNIVITDCSSDCCPGAEKVSSIKEALNILANEDEIFIIGGGMIYKQFLPLADKIYLTKVHKTYDADVYFPEIDMSQWKIIEEEDHLENDPPYSYLTLEKR